MKWCIALVALIAIFVYHRQNTITSVNRPFGKSVKLESSQAKSHDEEIVNVPDRDPLCESDCMDTYASILFATEGVPESGVDSTNADSELLEQSLTSMNQALTADETEAPFMELVDDQLPSEEIGYDEFGPDDLADDMDKLPKKLPIPEQNSQPEPRSSAGPIARPNPIKAVSLPDGVQINVVHHIEYGKSLARRGAIFGAQDEFQNALRLVAQAIDYQQNTREYSERLYQALVAMKEADDFYFAQSEDNGRVDFERIAKSHQSKILNAEQLANMTPVQVMQAYYNFVQDQFIICSGQTVVAGEALYCLGKLHVLKGNKIDDGSPLDSAKAIVHHRAAIECDPRNHKSANELGVLFSKTGRLKQARKLFLHSLKVQQVARAWENLASVHDRLGERHLAQLAMAEYQRMLSAPPSTNRIMWIPPERFAAQSAEPVDLTTDRFDPPRTDLENNSKKSSRFKHILKRMF